MKIKYPSDETQKRYKDIIVLLAKKAKDVDEKEYMSANLYFQGKMQVNSSSDIISELEDMRRSIIKATDILDQQSQISEKMKIKLRLLLYCHIIEAYPLYIYLYNLIEIANGKSYNLYIFGDPKIPLKTIDFEKELEQITLEGDNKKKLDMFKKLSSRMQSREISISDKINMISSKSKKLGIDLASIFNEFYDKDLRNAFAHNTYVFGDNFINLIFAQKKLLRSELVDKLSRGIYFYDCLFDNAYQELSSLFDEQERVYKGKNGTLTIKLSKDKKLENCYYISIKSSSTGRFL